MLMSTGAPGPHPGELRLLEIRRHPDFARHEHHQRLSDRGIIALGGRELGHAAGFRRRDHRAREIGFGDLQLRHGLLALRLQHRKLLLRDDDVALRSGEIRLRLAQARRVLLRLLDGDRALAYQIGVTLFLLLREGEIGLRFGGLLFRLLDARLLRGDLRVDVDDVGFALIELRLEVAIVEADQHGAGLDQSDCPSPERRRWRR